MTPAADLTICYLLRHGATESNVANPPRLQGRSVNLGLSPAGRNQADSAAKLLSRRPIAAVYASSLVRSRETAEAIARPHGKSVELVKAIVEVDVGRWEGRSWDEIRTTEPEAYRLFQEQCDQYGYSGGENLLQVQQRVTPAIRSLLERHAGEEIVIVGHNVVNRAYLAGVLSLPLSLSRTIVQDNGGVNVLHHRGGTTRAVSINATFHLDT